MSQQMESHFINTGFPTESFIYLFEGLPYNYAELSSSGMMHNQEDAYRSILTGSNKFEPSSPGNASFYGFDHAHVEDDHVLQTLEEPEPLVTPLTPESPEEYIRSHSNASSSQMFWQDNIDPDNMTYEIFVPA